MIRGQETEPSGPGRGAPPPGRGPRDYGLSTCPALGRWPRQRHLAAGAAVSLLEERHLLGAQGPVFGLGGPGAVGCRTHGPGSGVHSVLCGRTTWGTVPFSLSLDFVVGEVGQRHLSLGCREGELKLGQTFSSCSGAGGSRSGPPPPPKPWPHPLTGRGRSCLPWCQRTWVVGALGVMLETRGRWGCPGPDSASLIGSVSREGGCRGSCFQNHRGALGFPRPGNSTVRHQVQPWHGLGLKSPASARPTVLSRSVSLVGPLGWAGPVVDPQAADAPLPTPAGAPSPGVV